MAVIRDVMPAFELYQPASVEAALDLLDRHGASAWILAGGLDSFDWLKDRIKRLSVVLDLSGIADLKGVRQRRRARDRRDDNADRGRAASAGAAALRHPDEGGRGRCISADSQSGNNRRQRVAGHAMLHIVPAGRVIAPEATSATPTRRLPSIASTRYLNADRCVAVNPSDTSPALIALQAEMVIRSGEGERVVPAESISSARGPTSRA